jgi:hypothetical protein
MCLASERLSSRTIDCSINPNESREQEYAFATRLVKEKCDRQTFVFTISVMSVRPAFDEPARPLLVLRLGAGNGWSEMTLPLRHAVFTRLFFRRQYRQRCFGRSRFAVDLVGRSPRASIGSRGSQIGLA